MFFYNIFDNLAASISLGPKKGSLLAGANKEIAGPGADKSAELLTYER